jgi:hypothetical protein
MSICKEGMIYHFTKHEIKAIQNSCYMNQIKARQNSQVNEPAGNYLFIYIVD